MIEANPLDAFGSDQAEKDFFITTRGPHSHSSCQDDLSEGGFNINRWVVRGAYLPEVPVVHWISDNLKKDPFSLKYNIKELIDEGTYAKVYKCSPVDQPTVEYAVKLVSKQQILTLGMAGYLKREISIMRQLDCPSICRFIDFIETDTEYYLVMELLEGGTLDKEYAMYDEEEIRAYSYQVARALKHLHDNGVFHADLQLNNVCKANRDRGCYKVKVVDFGISDYYGEAKHSGFFGNLYYAAPEMLNGNKYDGRGTDVWAFGVCLFRLCAGYKPFKNANAIINGKTTIPIQDEDDLPEECKDLLSQIFQTNPNQRPDIDKILKHSFFEDCNVLI